MSQEARSPAPLAILGVGVLVAAGIGVGVWSSQTDPPAPEPDTAFVPADVAAPSVDPTTKKPIATTRVRKNVVPRDQAERRNQPGVKGDAPNVDPEGLKRALANSKNIRPAPSANTANRSAGRAAVKEAVSKIKPELKDCYESLIGEFPEAEGRVVVSMKLEAASRKGKVAEVQIGDGTTMFDERMLACVKDSALQIEFPFERDDGVVNVKYPFMFSNDEGGE